MRAALVLGVCAAVLGCGKRERSTAPRADSSAAPRAPASAAARASEQPNGPTPRRGMVWIPPGNLSAGTPRGTLPRLADQELAGEQVPLNGFYIDMYPYPNEEGALPQTHVSQTEAARLCEQQAKRLCSELEWERACKGPNNTLYEYGDRYRADRCATGSEPMLRPSGLRVGCASEFGVADMHGGVWEWTRSRWARGSTRPLIAIRGGNGKHGELVGRCANAAPRAPDFKAVTLGFRCCAGPPNTAQVTLQVDPTVKLKRKPVLEPQLTSELSSALNDAARAALFDSQDHTVHSVWDWWPIGNERLLVASACAGSGKSQRCGAWIVRSSAGKAQLLAWASSGQWSPTIKTGFDHRQLWITGGDPLGTFKVPVVYQWGRVNVGQRERKRPVKEPGTKRPAE